MPQSQSRRVPLSGFRFIQIASVLLLVLFAALIVTQASGFELRTLRLAFDEVLGEQLPVDGRSNLNGNAASFNYTSGPDLHEFITDENWNEGPNDGARWELRTSFTKGYNQVSLAHYIFVPRLDNEGAVANFVAGKEREHWGLAGSRVTHSEIVVGGRKGYVWDHPGRSGYWYYAAWFPQPIHTVRIECIAKKQLQRFKQLCAEATKSLEFH